MNKNINSKLMLVLSVFLILFLVLGSASAADDTDNVSNETVLTSEMDVDTVTTVDQDSVSAAEATDSFGSSDTGNGLLQSDDNIKTFDDLKTEISSSTGDTIVLTGKYYKYTGTTQNNNAIIITKTIDGNGTIIDGNNLARAFTLQNQNHITIKNINFINTYTKSVSHDNSGSAINIQKCTDILIENCTFNNTRNNNTIGGAILITRTNYTSINNCNFSNIANGHSGGAIDFYGSGTNFYNNVVNCNFYNISGSNGGAIEYYTANSTVKNCTFDKCYANTGDSSFGGAIALFQGCPYNNITDCNFTNCKSKSNYGGAIAIQSGEFCLIDNCYFENCTASNGGAIQSQSVNSTISNCIFINNSANLTNGLGGALRFNGQYGRIENCIFTNNNASEGGAVKFDGSFCYMGFCNYTNNTATIDGGALCVNAQNSTVENCTFTNNTAPSGKDFFAHGTYTINFIGLKFDTLYLTNNNYTYSVADGYGTNYQRPAAWLDTNTFLDSFLDTSHGKATIYLVGEITSLPEKILNIDGLEIVGYHPENNPEPCVVNMEGWDHRAFTTTGDGEIRFENITFKNSNINENATEFNGGVIKVSSEVVSIVNCTFTNNTAKNGGCIYVTDGSNIFTINTCNFTYNNATNGGAVYIEGTNNSMIYHSYFDYDTADLGGGAIYYNSTNILYYYIDDKETAQNNPTIFGSHNTATLIDENNTKDVYKQDCVSCVMDVYVLKDSYYTAADQGQAPNKPTGSLKLAFAMIASQGTIHFIGPNDSFDLYEMYHSTYPGDFDENGVYKYTHGKFGITFEGNNTSLTNVRFELASVAYETKVYNMTFHDTNGAVIICNARDCVMNNCTIINNGNNTVDGVLQINAIGALINNTKFINNTGVNGAALYLSSNANDTVIKDSEFINNTGVNGAGAYIEAGNIEMNGCTFTNNTVTSNGGAAYVNGNGTSLVNCNFTSNHASSTGGALYLTGDANNTQIINARFINNTASGDAGAIRLLSNGTSIVDSVFSLNKGSHGSSVFIFGNNTLISRCNFTNNNASSYDGAVIVWTKATENTIIEYSLFENNYANRNGGAIRIDQFTIVNNCTFINNTAKQNGGAISSQGDSIYANSTFTNNKATANGGAIYCYNDGLNILNCNFTDNNATSNGGAVYSKSCNISDSNFIGNNATNGGAIYFISNGNVTACTFTNNTATELGGGIYVAGNGLSLTKSNFTGNKAVNGSAVYLNETVTSFTVKDCEFKNNVAEERGTVYLVGVTGLSLGNSVFEDNTPGDIDDNYYLLDKQNPPYNASVVYVNSTGGGTGLTEDDPTSWDIAYNKILENPGVIILKSDIEVYQKLIDKNVTIVGNGFKLNRKDGESDKYMFNLPIISIDIIN